MFTAARRSGVKAANAADCQHYIIFQDGSSFVYAYGDRAAGFEFTSNIVSHGVYGIFGDNSSPGSGTLTQYFPPAAVTGNLIVGWTATYPPGNYYPATMADGGFVDLAGGDYRLANTCDCKYVAADGTDPGADMTTIR